MENAAHEISDYSFKALEYLLADLTVKPESVKISVICGGGNNGGDGYAAARHLSISGLNVKIFAVSDPQKLGGDAALARQIVDKMNLECVAVLDSAGIKAAALEWQNSKLIIDAILGTGFAGPLRPHVAEVIAAINAASYSPIRPIVLAVDIPSGLDCDTGIPAKPTIRAHLTVTFVARKIGFKNHSAQEVLGSVLVAPIGAPMEIVDRVLQMEEKEAKST